MLRYRFVRETEKKERFDSFELNSYLLINIETRMMFI